MVLFTSIHASINNRIDTVVSPASRFLNLLAAFFKWVSFSPRHMNWRATIGAAVSQRWTTLPPPPTPASMYLPPGSLNGTMATGGSPYLVVAVTGNERFLWDIGWTTCQAVDIWIRNHNHASIVIAIVIGGVLGLTTAHFLKRSERRSKSVRRYGDTGRALPSPSPWSSSVAVHVEDLPSLCPFTVATLPIPPVVSENSDPVTVSLVELDLDAIDFANIDPEDFGGHSDVDESDSEARENDHSLVEWQSEDEREGDEWVVYGGFATERMSLKIALEQSVLEDEDEDEEYFDALAEQPGQQVGCLEVIPVYVDEYMEWSLGPFVAGEEVSSEIASEQLVVYNAGDVREDVAFVDYSDATSDIVEARSDTPELLSIHLDGDSPVVLSHEPESSSDSLDFIQEQLQEDESGSPCPPSPAFYCSPPSSIPELVIDPPTPPLGNANGYTVWAYHSSPEYLNSVPEDQDRSILSPNDVWDMIKDGEGEEEYYVEDDGDEDWEDVSDEEEVYEEPYEDEHKEQEGQQEQQDASVVDHLAPLDSLESSFELSEEATEGLEDWINEDDAEEGDRTDAYADAHAAFNHLQSLGTVEAYSSDLMERFDAEDVEGLEEWIGDESVCYDEEEDEKEGEPWVEWWYGGEPDQPEEGEFGEEDDEVEDEEDTVRLSHGEVDGLEGFINDDDA